MKSNLPQTPQSSLKPEDADEELVPIEPLQWHTVAFTVLGTLKLHGVQDLLQKARDILTTGTTVYTSKVEPIDKNAIVV